MSAGAMRAAKRIKNNDLWSGYANFEEWIAKVIDEEMHSAEVLEVLKAVYPLTIPGMNWTDETGQTVKNMVKDMITKLED